MKEVISKLEKEVSSIKTKCEILSNKLDVIAQQSDQVNIHSRPPTTVELTSSADESSGSSKSATKIKWVERKRRQQRKKKKSHQVSSRDGDNHVLSSNIGPSCDAAETHTTTDPANEMPNRSNCRDDVAETHITTEIPCISVGGSGSMPLTAADSIHHEENCNTVTTLAAATSQSNKREIYVGNVHPDNTWQTIQSHLMVCGVHVQQGDITQLAHVNGSKSFKVVVPDNHYTALIEKGGSMWPAGVKVRPFYASRRGSSKWHYRPQYQHSYENSRGTWGPPRAENNRPRRQRGFTEANYPAVYHQTNRRTDHSNYSTRGNEQYGRWYNEPSFGRYVY